MTAASLLAAAAGACLAAAIVEYAATARPRRRRRGLLRRVLARLPRPGAPGGLAARVDASGVRLGVGEVMAAKVAGAAAGGALVATVLPPGGAGRLGPVALLALPAAGWFAPDLVLRARARARSRAVAAELADVLDLLRVAVGAGLAPWRAVAEVGRRHPGVLAQELAAAARRVSLGVPAEQALALLERRTPGTGVRALAAVLRRADRLGAGPGSALAALAEDARARRAQRLAEQAARAAPKIQLVVALLLVPSVLLLVAAALIPALTGASL